MKADPGKIKDGNQGEIKVPHYVKDSGQQATYALFSANNDAICVAYLTITVSMIMTIVFNLFNHHEPFIQTQLYNNLANT